MTNDESRITTNDETRSTDGNQIVNPQSQIVNQVRTGQTHGSGALFRNVFCPYERIIFFFAG